ncbi:MAG: hypothetical protein AAF446_03815 [Pseudomonadota bacterium]
MSLSSVRNTSSLQAGAVYFALVFALGFVLGTLRVFLLVPQFGQLYSGLIELPVILTAAWLICRWLVNRYALEDHWTARVLMGTTAFVLLMVAELILSMTLFERSMVEYLAVYRSLHGALGLFGQVVYALFPLLVKRNGQAGRQTA